MMNTEIYKLFSENGHRVSIDSRTVARGDIFFALKGEHFDGNRFAANAISNGAVVAVIDNPDYYTEGALIVEDTLQELQSLARTYRSRLSVPLLAVTGSNGKTTTRELITAVLSVSRKVHSSTANFNNHIGLPLTILQSPEGTEMIVAEMGANHAGEIDELCGIADPQYGIITNIGKAHLEGFGSPEAVAEAKSELYLFLAKNHGLAFVNEQDDILLNLVDMTGVDSWHYNTLRQGSVSGIEWRCDPYLNIEFSVGSVRYSIKTKLTGSYNLTNILAAVVVGSYFGIETDDIVKAIESYEPLNNRSQVIKTGSNIIIGDSYNANPASMKSSISSFVETFDAPRMVILGDMLELGEYCETEHLALIDWLRSLPEMEIMLAGEYFYKVAGNENVKRFRTTGELVAFLKQERFKGYNILVKGSRRLKMEAVYEYL